MSKTSVSVVIPFYNEAHRLEPGLSQALEYLSSNLGEALEIVLVDDGSTDTTLSILNTVREKFAQTEIRIISYPKNEGKGFAVKNGILEATGEKIIVTDADFSIDLKEIDGFLNKLDTHDIVIGSKKHTLTNTIKHQKFLRRILGKGFTYIVNTFLGLKFTDITCGFKGFKSDVAKELFDKQKTKRWSYDAEILFLAKKRNYRVAEIPVTWKHIEGGTISALPETFKSLRDLAVIIISYYWGGYK